MSILLAICSLGLNLILSIYIINLDKKIKYNEELNNIREHIIKSYHDLNMENNIKMFKKGILAGIDNANDLFFNISYNETNDNEYFIDGHKIGHVIGKQLKSKNIN